MEYYLKQFQTLVAKEPNVLCVSFVNSNCDISNSFTRIQLWNASRNLGYLLKSKYQLKKGDRCIICYPFGIDFLVGFFACLQVGIVAVSVYPPDPNQLAISIPKFAHFVEDSGATVVLTTSGYKQMKTITQATGKRWPKHLKWIASDKIEKDSIIFPSKWDEFLDIQSEIELEETAFIQYTSGSTSAPKGVIISHRALTHQLQSVDTFCSPHHRLNGKRLQIVGTWAPQYHDLGLIAGYLTSIIFGYTGSI